MTAKRRTGKGFTILELIVSVAIIGVLAAVSVSAFHRIRRQAEKAGCIANLKNIHTGFDAHILDKGRWPQMPEKALNGDESEYHAFWILSLTPYGVDEEMWQCPSDRYIKEKFYGNDKYKSSYAATRFNPHGMTPYRWNQPWVAERGDFHGKGAHVLMPDGSVNPSTSAFGGR